MLRVLEPVARRWTAVRWSWTEDWTRALVLGLAAALLARVQPMAGLAPFALAFLAAGLAAGESPALLLAGSGVALSNIASIFAVSLINSTCGVITAGYFFNFTGVFKLVHYSGKKFCIPPHISKGFNI